MLLPDEDARYSQVKLIFLTKIYKKNDMQTTLVIFALIAALGLVTVVAVDLVLTMQEVDAAPRPTKGCNNSQAANASLGRCVR
jgi:hypothetical protein